MTIQEKFAGKSLMLDPGSALQLMLSLGRDMRGTFSFPGRVTAKPER